MAALASNSYGSLQEVAAQTRHLLDGEEGFSEATTPTDSDVASIMDRVSGVLNMALSAEGFSIPISDTDGVLACNQFVVDRTVRELRFAYPHLGIGAEERASLPDLYKAAREFASMYADAFKNIGETVSAATSEGLDFTGLVTRTNRSDPSNTTYEQPKFRRGLFDA